LHNKSNFSAVFTTVVVLRPSQALQTKVFTTESSARNNFSQTGAYILRCRGRFSINQKCSMWDC